MRPAAAGVASRGRVAAAVRVAATALSRRAGGRRDFVQNALPSSSSSGSTSAVGFLTSKATSSTSYHQHGSSDDGKDLTHWAVLAMGSALALWTSAATGGDDKAAAGVASCSAAMEKNSNQYGDAGGVGGVGGHPSVDAPRRLTKRRSILLAEDEVDKQSGQSYYSPSSPSAAGDSPPADPTVSDNAPGVSLVVASTYNGNGPIEDRHDIRQSPRGDFFVSVLDGHGGWQAAELARKRLNIAAQTELKTSLAGNPEQVWIGRWVAGVISRNVIHAR